MTQSDETVFLDRPGRDQIGITWQICLVLGLELIFRQNFAVILHHFVWRNLEKALNHKKHTSNHRYLRVLFVLLLFSLAQGCPVPDVRPPGGVLEGRVSIAADLHPAPEYMGRVRASMFYI